MFIRIKVLMGLGDREWHLGEPANLAGLRQRRRMGWMNTMGRGEWDISE